ncbi:TadE/TadG family type IV pilus assembly protein [Arthrobacter sp. B0490]|uniref:TadE/TadG family type IV pilus assembly protein n=1 Tax=Arthrobacter sp. B0490 TaxID=2058891 RepID=UPI000CE50AF7|nr:TadE/TadG family type IV pilus assembly protein [Arthrobacter sp. B0490]
MSTNAERGAAAVEMALLLPVLILLLLGIMEFGRAFGAQVTLTSAGRESVRVMAISKDELQAKNSAVAAASTLRPALTASNVAIAVPGATSGDRCPAGSTATVTITYSLSTLTNIAGPFSMTGRAVMLCGG